MTNSWIPSIITRGLSLVLVTGCITAGSTAIGQETHGLTPKTMDSEWFNTEVKRLGLEYDQRIVLEAAHERYKAIWRRFRDTDLKALAETMEEIDGGGGMPDRELIEKVVDRGRSVNSRIEQMERMLFEELAPHLRADQAVQFQRFRNLRERARYETDIITNFGGGNGLVNLTRLVDQLELSPDEAFIVEDALHQYEVSINSAVKSLYSSTMSMILDLFEIMEEMGITDDIGGGDAEAAMQMQMAFMHAMQKAAEDRQEAASHAANVNEGSYTHLKGQMSPDTAGRFEDLFRRATYPEIYNDPGSPERVIDRALESDEVTPAQRGDLQDVATQWRSRYASISNRLVQLTDQTRDAEGDMMFGGQNEELMELWEEFKKLRQQREELNSTTTERIKEILGEELARQLSAKQQDKMKLATIAYTVNGAVGRAQSAQSIRLTMDGSLRSVSFRGRGKDATFPRAIGSTELDFYLDRLSFDPDLKVIAHEFLGDYKDAHTTLHQERYNTLVTSAKQQLWKDGAISEEAIDRYADGRQQMLDAILELEGDFFDQIGVLVDPNKQPTLQAIRQARLCSVYDLGEAAYRETGGIHVDYYGIVLSLALRGDEMAGLNPAFESYESAALPIFRAQHRNFIARQEAQQRAKALWQTKDGDEVEHQRIWEEQEDLMAPTERAMWANAEDRDKLDQQLAADLRANLPGRVMSAFEDQYNRAAYPQVYPDRADAVATFEQAMQLPELTDAQRAQIESLWGTHLVEHAAYCNELMQIIDITRSDSDFDDEDSREAQAYRQAQNRKPVAQYDRLELNETSRRALRGVLSEEQAARIRGLDVEIARE